MKGRISGTNLSEYYNEAYLDSIQNMGCNDYKQFDTFWCYNEYTMSP